jgi:hypothetical protein
MKDVTGPAQTRNFLAYVNCEWPDKSGRTESNNYQVENYTT